MILFFLYDRPINLSEVSTSPGPPASRIRRILPPSRMSRSLCLFRLSLLFYLLSALILGGVILPIASLMDPPQNYGAFVCRLIYRPISFLLFGPLSPSPLALYYFSFLLRVLSSTRSIPLWLVPPTFLSNLPDPISSPHFVGASLPSSFSFVSLHSDVGSPFLFLSSFLLVAVALCFLIFFGPTRSWSHLSIIFLLFFSSLFSFSLLSCSSFLVLVFAIFFPLFPLLIFILAISIHLKSFLSYHVILPQ